MTLTLFQVIAITAFVLLIFAGCALAIDGLLENDHDVE